MAELRETHPEIDRKFREGKFTVHKATKVLSSIPIDRENEHHDAALRRHMITASELPL